MADYKCFHCAKEVAKNLIRKRINCPYCGSKILFKQRDSIAHVKAR